MNADEIIRKLRGATVEPYQLGLTFPDQMIQPVPEHCQAVAAGPLTFVVESRHLTDEAVGTVVGSGAQSTDALFDDFGGTVHVNGTDDGLEYLRFDCFEEKPHYHYVHYPEASNTVCRLDQFANGDPLPWTLARLRNNLPDMLDSAGSTELAAKVRADEATVVAAVDEVERLLREADAKARAEWSTA